MGRAILCHLPAFLLLLHTPAVPLVEGKGLPAFQMAWAEHNPWCSGPMKLVYRRMEERGNRTTVENGGDVTKAENGGDQSNVVIEKLGNEEVWKKLKVSLNAVPTRNIYEWCAQPEDFRNKVVGTLNLDDVFKVHLEEKILSARS